MTDTEKMPLNTGFGEGVKRGIVVGTLSTVVAVAAVMGAVYVTKRGTTLETLGIAVAGTGTIAGGIAGIFHVKDVRDQWQKAHSQVQGRDAELHGTVQTQTKSVSVG